MTRYKTHMGKPKVINALRKLLLETDLESLLTFLHRIGVNYTIRGNTRSKHHDLFECRIFIQQVADGQVTTVREYVGGCPPSQEGSQVRYAVVDAMAQFLIHEEHDFHDYVGGGPRGREANEARKAETAPHPISC